MDYIALLKVLGTLIVVLTAVETVLNVGEKFHGYYKKFSNRKLSSHPIQARQPRLFKKINSATKQGLIKKISGARPTTALLKKASKSSLDYSNEVCNGVHFAPSAFLKTKFFCDGFVIIAGTVTY